MIVAEIYAYIGAPLMVLAVASGIAWWTQHNL